MKVRIEIDTNNAAFEDAPDLETARILDRLSDELYLTTVPDRKTLYDINGNAVGTFERVGS